MDVWRYGGWSHRAWTLGVAVYYPGSSILRLVIRASGAQGPPSFHPSILPSFPPSIPFMLLLAIETSGDVCGLALADGETVLYHAALAVPRSHGAHLAPMIAEALDRAGAAPGDVRAVAVSAGPGSYTGLRIGVSTAKGLCVASGAALVAVPTLTAVAWAARPWVERGTVVVAALPSRRGEVYAGVVDITDPAAIPAEGAYALDTFPADLGGDGPTLVVGPAAGVVANALKSAGRADVRVVPVAISALHVAAIGAARLAAGLVEDLAGFEPNYVTPAYVVAG